MGKVVVVAAAADGGVCHVRMSAGILTYWYYSGGVCMLCWIQWGDAVP